VGTGVADACTDDARQKALSSNQNIKKTKVFQSAYKLTNTENGRAVYYVSQFPGSDTPAALPEEDRKAYTKFVAKAAGAVPQPVQTGLACELLTGTNPTKDTVAGMCAADGRCVGYYTSDKPYLEPVMAMAPPGNCKLDWAKLPAADQPTETDACTKGMGDAFWFTDNGFCVPTCPDEGGRTNTGLCKVCTSMKGWGKSSSTAKDTCVPMTEDTCPTGWVIERNGDYPAGVCRPPCSTGGREEDGFCSTACEKNKGVSMDGYGGHWWPWPVQQWSGRTWYCRPSAAKLKEQS
jgi:hypothetical protein